MANYAQCILDNIKDRGVGKKRAQEFLDRYDNLLNENLADGMTRADAETKAAADAVFMYDKEVSSRKARMLKNMAVQKSAQQKFQKVANEGGNMDLALLAYIESQPRHRDVTDAASSIEAAKRKLGRTFFDLAYEYGRKGLGLWQKKAGQIDVLQEIFKPNSTSNVAAQKLAQAWRDTVDVAISMYRDAGGSIVERSDWNLPQHMDRHKLYRDGEDAFVQKMMPLLDWKKMRRTDGSRIPPNKREESLRDVFQTLTSGGANRANKMTAGQSGTGNLLDKHRFLVLKDADGWLSMHENYGQGSVFDVMVGHIESMSHRIGMTQALGPSPSLMKEFLKRQAKKSLANVDIKNKQGKLQSATIETAGTRMDEMFALLSRENRMPDANRMGAVGAAVRNVLTSSLLGGASLAAIPGDLVTGVARAWRSNVPASRFLTNYVKQWNPLDETDRVKALRITGALDNWMSQAIAASRFTGLETYGPAWSRYVSDVTLRANLLSPHTAMARNAYEMDLMGNFTDNAAKSWDEVSFRPLLEEFGLTKKDWDTYRKTPIRQTEGLIHLDDVYAVDREVGNKFMRMFVAEGRQAVLDSTFRAASLWGGATTKGTFPGEILGSVAMFKNFTTTVLQTIMYDALAKGGLNRGEYMSSLIIGMTMAGAMSVQLKQISAGNDPISMFEEDGSPNLKFWGAATLQGGGLGIFGDFLFADHNRFGGGFFQSLIGPPAQFFDDTTKLTYGNFQDILEGKDTKVAAELVNYIDRYLPGQNTFWFRLPLERMVFDQMETWADPKAQEKRKRRDTLRRKDYGNDTWWADGDFYPKRAPDFGAAFGQ